MTFDEYLELAKEKQQLNTLNDLANVLGVEVSDLENFRSNPAFVPFDKLFQLASLAGVRRAHAMLDKHLWCTKDDNWITEYKNLEVDYERPETIDPVGRLTAADYVRMAKQNQGFRSERQLAEFIEISHTSLRAIRLGHTQPSETTMLLLSGLAGINPLTGFADLALWRSKDEAAMKIWENLADLVKKVAPVLALVISMTIALTLTPQSDAFAKGTSAEQVNIETSHFYKLCDISSLAESVFQHALKPAGFSAALSSCSSVCAKQT